MDSTIVIGMVVAFVVIFLIGKTMMVPLRHVIKLMLNGLIGGALLWLVNLVGAAFSIHVPINIVTALVAGFLGIPGVILLVGLKVVFG